MSKRIAKLNLSRTTLRRLSSGSLEAAAGGTASQYFIGNDTPLPTSQVSECEKCAPGPLAGTVAACNPALPSWDIVINPRRR